MVKRKFVKLKTQGGNQKRSTLGKRQCNETPPRVDEDRQL